DFGVIVVGLRVNQETYLVECLLDSEAPASDLGLCERTPDFKFIRQQVSAQQLANIEVSVKAKVAIGRGIAIGQPLPADAGLDVSQMRGRLRDDAAAFVTALFAR